jgi:hypothetical protein
MLNNFKTFQTLALHKIYCWPDLGHDPQFSVSAPEEKQNIAQGVDYCIT